MTTLKRYSMDHGSRIALVGEPGRKFTPLVYIDSPIRVWRVPNVDKRYFHDVEQGARGLKPTARSMLKAGKQLGITVGAKKFLRAIIAESTT